jgi:hypothetical protein
MEIRRRDEPYLTFHELRDEWQERYGRIDHRSHREGNGSMKPEKTVITAQRVEILRKFCEEYQDILNTFENGWDVRKDHMGKKKK